MTYIGSVDAVVRNCEDALTIHFEATSERPIYVPKIDGERERQREREIPIDRYRER